MAGILVMGPYSGTGSSVSIRVFDTSISVSEKGQKNLGDSTYPVSKTRSMKMMTISSSGADGVMYMKTYTWDVWRVPRWYTSVTSSFGTRTGPLEGSASQITWRMQGKSLPN